MSAKSVEIIPASGTEVLIPLNKLKKSPNNARKTPHSEAAIEGYAASIAAKGILQNLVVEPEFDGEGAATGFYLVTIGEGRRLAQLLRVKRKEIKKTEPIRCVIDTANDPHEISLDENVTRENMHPADQFEAFRKLADERGLGAEEIADRFGVTAHVVRQRLRLTLLARAFLASHVPLEFVNRRPLLAPHNVERDGLMRLAAEALHLKIAIARVQGVHRARGTAALVPGRRACGRSTPRKRAHRHHGEPRSPVR